MIEVDVARLDQLRFQLYEADVHHVLVQVLPQLPISQAIHLVAELL